MKRLILFILFLFSINIIYAQRDVDADRVIVRDSLNLKGDWFTLETPTDGEFIQRENGRWINKELERSDYTNVVIVDQGGSYDYTTITSAMGSITDAAADNTYAIWVMGGDYTTLSGEVFPIVMKDYVAIIGFDDDLVRISGSETSLFTLGTYKSSLRDVAITHTPTASGYTFTASNAASTAENKIQNCDLNYITSTAGVAGGFINITSAGLLVIQDCLMIYQNTGGSAVASTTNLMNYSGDLQVFFDTNVLSAYTNQTSGDFNVFNNSSTYVTTLSNSDLTTQIASASWNDTIVGWRVNSSNSVTKFSVNTITRFVGAGLGTVYGAYSNTGGTSVIDLNTITFKFSNFASEYFAWAESPGDEINGIFANGEADNPTGTGIGGNGTVRKTVIENNNFVTNQSFIDENMRLDENTTNQSINDLFNGFFSAGWWSGGAITDNGNSTVDIGSGTGLIRTANDEQADVQMFDWPDTTALAVPLGDSYIYVDYNSGNPLVKLTTDGESIKSNENDKFELYSLVREAGDTLHISDHKHRSKNTISLVQQLLYDIASIRRTDGLIIGGTGTRNVTVTAGTIWIKLNKILISAINTSTGDNFDRYYRDGIGGWTKQIAETQWDNANFDDGTGTLAAIGSNKYSYQDFYIDADGGLACLYGQTEYTAELPARNAPLSSTAPDRISDHALYIGRVTFQEGTDVGNFYTAFGDIDLGGSGVTDHNTLSGLQGGTANEYYHLTNAELTKLQDSTVINEGISTDNAIPRFDGATGKIIQNSSATIDDSGNTSFNGNLFVYGGDIFLDNERDILIRNSGNTAYHNVLRYSSSNDLILGQDAVRTLLKASGINVLVMTSTGIDVTGDLDVTGEYQSNGTDIFPAVSTDNAIVRFDGTTGKKLQNSSATIDDTGNANFSGDVDVNGEFTNTYTETEDSDIRPVIFDQNYTISPATSIGTTTDYHGTDIYMTTASANVNSNVALYPLETRVFYNTSGTLGRMVGAYSLTENQSSGTVNEAVGLQLWGRNRDTGTLSDYRGILIYNPLNDGGGTITNAYGIYIQDFTTASNNNYGIFSLASNNYLKNIDTDFIESENSTTFQGKFHGWWTGGAHANHGSVQIGSNSNYSGYIEYDADGGDLFIRNSFNNANGDIVFRTNLTTDILRLKGDLSAIFSSTVQAETYYTGEQSLTETAGAVSWDVSAGSEVGVTIDETTVITLTNLSEGWKGNIDITQGDAGDDNVTFVSSGYTVKWRGGDTDLTDASGAIDVISLRVRGTVIYVTLGSDYQNQ